MDYNHCASYQDMGSPQGQYMAMAAAYMDQSAAESLNSSYVPMQGPEPDVMAGGASTSLNPARAFSSGIQDSPAKTYSFNPQNYNTISYQNLDRNTLNHAIEAELSKLQ